MMVSNYDEWSYERYLDFESRSETRHEYHQGTVYAMSGNTREHSLIKGNIAGVLHNQLRGIPCDVHMGDLLVAPLDHHSAFHPDVSVVCGDGFFERGQIDILLNPTFIVEVLSSSTERKDTLIKLPIYQAMPSVMDILYVRQDRVHITHYKRDGDDWPTVFYRALTDDIVLESMGCTLRVVDVYARISFEAP